MSEYSTPLNFIDLAAKQARIRDRIEKAIMNVLDHGQYIMGPEVTQFEQELVNFTCANHAISCANGTDALTVVMMAWGVGPGDAVFIPSFTYVASAETPAQLGATPFFVDIREETFNIDPESFRQAIQEAEQQGLRPAVVIPVDLFGLPADIETVTEIAQAHDIKVLVDGAQSFGASCHDQIVGTMGDATTTSFFPAKPLGCYGDGGAVFTNDSDLASRISSIRLHGKGEEKYDNVIIGLNSRLDTIQAAILIEKLKIFPEEILLRRKVAEYYSSRLREKVAVPTIPEGYESVWAQYTLRLGEKRDAVRDHLKSLGIPAVVYYPKALTQQLGYQHYPVVSTGVSVSEKIPGEVLSLPMHPYLTEEQLDHICQAVLAAI
jgi:dTDP-4-amino-4,6-dideoxygalactose transaminase